VQNTFLAPGQVLGVQCTPGLASSCLGAIDAITGDVVDFKLVNGNLERNAGRGAAFFRNDVSLKKQFRIAKRETLRLELEADVINVFNHSNLLGFNSNNDTSNLGFGVLDPTVRPGTTGFFDCTNCIRPNGTLVGNSGQVLHISDLTHGTLSKNLLQPAFGTFGGSIGDPAFNDEPRKIQLAFRVRF
jgi:hypothetical protein